MLPQTGALVAEYSSDDIILQHARIGPGSAGVNIQGLGESFATSAITWGVIVAMVVGKPLGVLGTTWLVTKSGLGRLAAGIKWRDLLAIGSLFGMCFTVSLLMAQLAFPAGHSDAGASAFTEQSHSIGVLSVFVATSVSALISTILMRRRASVLAKGSVNV